MARKPDHLLLAVIAAAALAAGAAGCGGDDRAESPGAIAASADGTESRLQPAELTAADEAREEEIAAALAERDARERRLEAAAKRRRARRAAERKRKADVALARSVTAALLDSVGLPKADVSVARDARLVRVVVEPDQLCDAQQADDSEIAQRLREALPFVEAARVGARGQSGAFAEVRRRVCFRALEPTGRETFFEHTAKGPYASGVMDIADGRWAIDYLTDGTFLQVVVIDEAGRARRRSITAGAGETGTRTFRGPSSISLRIAGDGRWSVRVRAAG